MPRWKWFQRRQKPLDAVGPATCYPHRAGSYGNVGDRPASATESTVAQPQVGPLLTPGQEHQAGDLGPDS
jgi:hypothetical protein